MLPTHACGNAPGGEAAPARILRVSSEAPAPAAIREAAQALQNGALVAFPTETVYGLGAHALDAAAVARIFRAKGRPADNPLIVHIADAERLREVARDVPPIAQAFIDRFWPGPLTLVFPRSDRVPDIVTAGGDTVAVRCPAHPVATALLRAARLPVAAPSANRSGRPSPTRAEHVAADLGDDVALILDAGACRVGLESTVLDVTVNPPVILRLGAVTLEMLRDMVPAVKAHPHALGVRPGPDETVASPGVRHRHYAPQTPLYLYTGREARGVIRNALAQADQNNERLGLLLTSETARELAPHTQGHAVEVVGARDDAAAWAAGLFHALRALDSAGVSRILAEGIPQEGLGAAVMDRLQRAAYSPEDDY